MERKIVFDISNMGDPRFDVEEFTRLEHCVAGKLCEGKLGFVIQIAETYDGNNCKRR